LESPDAVKTVMLTRRRVTFQFLGLLVAARIYGVGNDLSKERLHSFSFAGDFRPDIHVRGVMASIISVPLCVALLDIFGKKIKRPDHSGRSGQAVGRKMNLWLAAVVLPFARASQLRLLEM